MADQHSIEGSSTSNVSAESSESTVELNIKTLDSQMYSFRVNKNMLVSAFKEKIAGEIGVPVGQQRLIFRGKVLKDDHPLSEYHVENGHTLHLVARQPSQAQPPSGTSTGETTTSSGQEANAGGPRARVGQVSHSVVLGTFNVGEQGEAVVPDLSRVIGAVLNSFGIGNQTAINGGAQPNVQANIPAPGQAPQGNETEGTRGNASDQRQAGNQTYPGQAFLSQSIPQVLPIPLGAAIPIPSLNVPIPDSLNTLSEFMNRVELALSVNGYQPNQSLNSTGDLPTVELPSNARGLATPEALGIVLRHAQRLLGGQAVAALSHVAGQVEQEGASTDPTVRTGIQTGSMQVGLAMQHLGALLLELGRTMMTLRMGRSVDEAYVNAGPAVYISPSGPNPIMVQPFPLQTSPLFGGSAAPLNPGPFGPIGAGPVPRHVNIHIHTAVGPRPTNGEGMQGTRVNGAGSGVFPARNVIATAIPSQPSGVAASGALQPGVTVPQLVPDAASLSTVVADVSSRIRNFVNNMGSENQASSGQPESLAVHNQSNESSAGIMESRRDLRNLAGNGVGETSQSPPDCKTEVQTTHPEATPEPVDDTEFAARSSQVTDNPEASTGVPLGLGLGGLQPKRSRQPRPQDKGSDGATSTAPINQNQRARPDGQQILQSLSSLANTRNVESVPMGGDAGGGAQFDPASVMSQVLNSPALNGLLSGVSQQTGVGSPDVLRNMLGQLTQSPAMMNTVNQIARQMDDQHLGNMFSGLGGGGQGGGGGGFDLSSMIQQMMPIVSQALGGGSNLTQQVPPVERELQPLYDERWSSGDDHDQNSQIDLQQAARRIEHRGPPEEIFRSVVESAADLHDNNIGEGLVDVLCAEDGLATEFMEMLRRDISRRLQDETGSAEKP